MSLVIRNLLVLICLHNFTAQAQNSQLHFKNYLSRNDDTFHLFGGVNNPVMVFGEGFKPKDYEIDAEGADIGNIIYRGDTLAFNILPARKKQTIKLIHRTSHRQSKQLISVVDTFAFPRVRLVPGNTITKELFKEYNTLLPYTVNPMFRADRYFSITGYRFQTVVGRDTVNIWVKGANATEEIKEIVSKLPSNTTLTYSTISATCASCRNLHLPDYKILVK